jgi:hypothetical protein
MVTTEQARALALGLPDAVEQDHHGRPSFRVSRRIFATLWDHEHMNVMVDEPGILTAVQAHPDICAEVWWGKRLAAVRVALPSATADLLRELLTDAWERKSGRRAA